MKTQREEVQEALSAGMEVLQQIDYVEQNLKSAKGWGILDMFTDGGFLSALIKHSKLDNAQAAMQSLSRSVERFNAELKDIHIYNDVGDIAMSDGMRLADWFLDNIFVDAMVLSHISDSQRQVEDLKRQVRAAMDKLYYLMDTIDQLR